ncbi:MAG: hypothetical protein WC942_05480 [Clostridia bacterium]
MTTIKLKHNIKADLRVDALVYAKWLRQYFNNQPKDRSSAG